MFCFTQTLTTSHSLQVVPCSFCLSSFLRITATCAKFGYLSDRERGRERDNEMRNKERLYLRVS